MSPGFPYSSLIGGLPSQDLGLCESYPPAADKGLCDKIRYYPGSRLAGDGGKTGTRWCRLVPGSGGEDSDSSLGRAWLRPLAPRASAGLLLPSHQTRPSSQSRIIVLWGQVIIKSTAKVRCTIGIIAMYHQDKSWMPWVSVPDGDPTCLRLSPLSPRHDARWV